LNDTHLRQWEISGKKLTKNNRVVVFGVAFSTADDHEKTMTAKLSIIHVLGTQVIFKVTGSVGFFRPVSRLLWETSLP